ncbi:MAG TPA: haloacid dehalogenase type II [Plasticicumulans sp.]|nr:haloacid dehalogenase type II [Plasticicumulans sp.]
MSLTRRRFLKYAAASASAAALARLPTASAATAAVPVAAIALDGFTTFDPRPLAALAEQLFPDGAGKALTLAWRTRQFEYTWLRTLMNRYADFWQVTGEALDFAAAQTGLKLGGEQRDRLMQGWLELRAWPDAAEALRALKAEGLRLAFLSNFTPAMLDRAVAGSGLDGLFDEHLSTDRVRAFKPDPRAYAMAEGFWKLPREAIAFAAFGGWDAAGARAYGYPTFWVNRAGVPAERLDTLADASGATLTELAAWVRMTRG